MSPVEGALSEAGTPTWYMQDHEVKSLPTPAVATGFTYSVPGAVVQRVMGLSFVLVADANAANRIPRVEYLDAEGNVFHSVAAPFVLTATLTCRFSFAVGTQQFGANGAAAIGAPLPPFELVPGLAVRVAVAAIQATDQISAASLFLDQWPVRA